MKKSFSSLALYAVFLFCSLSLYAVDFGLVFTQNADVKAPNFDFENIDIGISGVLTPRFTALPGGIGDLYISAAVNYEAVTQDGADPIEIIPELTRTDFAFNLGSADIKIGRMFYSDPMGLVANNLFDGAQVSFITDYGNFQAGVWYTGFLYKKRAAITMTDNEQQLYSVKVDYDDFVNTYFAPSRVLAALEYNHPALAGFIGLNISLIAQNDMGNDKLNSQYFTAVLSVPGKNLIFDLGGCFELIEYKNETTPAFAGVAGLTFILPSTLEKHIKISGRYSSGVSEEKTYGAFLPLTTVTQGEILEAKFSGLSLLCAEFTGRLAKSFSANMAFIYFIRTDLGTYKAYPAIGGAPESFFLGGEIFGRFIWNLSTGVRLNLGTGAFLPSLGNVNPDGYTLWRTNLNLIISIY
jgi:hypothetical protein